MFIFRRDCTENACGGGGNKSSRTLAEEKQWEEEDKDKHCNGKGRDGKGCPGYTCMAMVGTAEGMKTCGVKYRGSTCVHGSKDRFVI